LIDSRLDDGGLLQQSSENLNNKLTIPTNKRIVNSDSSIRRHDYFSRLFKN